MALRPRLLCALFAAAVILSAADVSAQWETSSNKAGEQRKAEKGLKDNRYFIFFLNTTITNNGTDMQKAVFRDIVQRDIMSQFFYLKFMFYDSYVEIRKSQRKLIDLYRELLRADVDLTKSLLDAFAPSVVACNDPLAREYLRLGYRETVNTSIEMGMADAYRPTLYSMRLYKYVKAIKRIKEAKKYAFYAGIRAKMTPDEKKKIPNITLADVNARLEGIVPRAEVERFKLQSLDAFYRTAAAKSFFDELWENPDLDSLPDFQKYMKTDK